MRLIDADALDFSFDRRCFSDFDEGFVRGADEAIAVVNNAPTIEAEPVKHGRWLEKVGRAKCSACADECWADSVMEYNYCPNCGAKMDGERRDTE